MMYDVCAHHFLRIFKHYPQIASSPSLYKLNIFESTNRGEKNNKRMERKKGRNINLIKTVAHRALIICSKIKLGSKIYEIKHLLIENGYPEDDHLACFNGSITKFSSENSLVLKSIGTEFLFSQGVSNLNLNKLRHIFFKPCI